ncbi:MAG: DNA replication and repair protein RecF [Rikenellaceae bacterium]|nr:DNA replication and repair protein RecF [Rikenellaceae bacterium]
MFLKKLSIISFKNIEQAALEVAPGVNCFVGENGAGKTNLLDAIHYLSMCKSALGMTDSQSLRHGAEFFVVEGDYGCEGGEGRAEKIFCSFKPSAGKKIRRGEKEYERAAEHIGLIPIVIVTPSDSALVSDSAEERRRFLNSFLSQLDSLYLNALVRYNRLLAERNKLLKTSASGELMDVLDMQLARCGGTIHARRAELVEKMAPLAERYYKTLSDDGEQVALSYRSELNELTMEQLLVQNRERDAMNGFTTGGVHRDDLAMSIGGYALRRYGSQGQQKSLLVALKLAQYDILAERCATRPILLLDDLFDKLDVSRVERLLGIICATGFGQVFISDCNKVRLEELLVRRGVERSLFNVEGGEITAI